MSLLNFTSISERFLAAENSSNKKYKTRKFALHDKRMSVLFSKIDFSCNLF